MALGPLVKSVSSHHYIMVLLDYVMRCAKDIYTENMTTKG